MSTGWKAINLVVDIAFLVDILITFNLATYDEDMVVIDDRWRIAEDYLKSWFIIDLISIIPFELIAQ